MPKTREEYNAYMREYMLVRYHKRRRQAVNQLGGKCNLCGSVETLELDHQDPATKNFTMARGASFSEVRWSSELKKCQLLCRGCHEEKSIREKGHQVAKGSHGTVSTYRYCKCDECREAWNKHSREYKRKRRLVRVIGNAADSYSADPGSSPGEPTTGD